VDGVVAVDIAEDEQHLLHHLPSLFFGKRPVAPHLLGKRDPLNKLLHQVEFAAFLEVGVELGDLRVLPQALQHLGLAVKQFLRQPGQLGRIFSRAQLLDHPPGLGGHVLIAGQEGGAKSPLPQTLEGAIAIAQQQRLPAEGTGGGSRGIFRPQTVRIEAVAVGHIIQALPADV
jgi:hypothetical protein